MQKFVSKKLTKLIESRVEFVDIIDVCRQDLEIKTEETKDEIKLLNDVILQINWNRSEETVGDQRKKPQIRKRILSDADDSKTESMRLSEAVFDPRYIQEEVSNWRIKPKRLLFEYREKNGKLFEVEENEFSEKRRKNNWDESKIARNKTF